MPKTSPWNKGKSVGQKAPFSPRDVQTIKQILANEGNLRDLALFSMGIDTMLRGVDRFCRKFCSGGAEGVAILVREGVMRPGRRTVRPR
jgi:hypothetical protein